MSQPGFCMGETVLVIGLGKSGLAACKVLRTRGVMVYATDEKPSDELTAARDTIEELGAYFISPESVSALADTLTCAVLSPGVPLTSPVVRSLAAAHTPILGEIEVASQLCRAPIIAVTGTKGKSTTTALIGHLLRHCGLRVRVGGNIGNPLIAEVADASADEWVVAEVSSFQLETIATFHPRVSVLLNVAPDHLDRYESMHEYAEAKFRIFANQTADDVFVGNLDDDRVATLGQPVEPRRVMARRTWFTLGDGAAANMYMRGSEVMYRASADAHPVVAIDRTEIPLAGEHNVQNVMAALLAAVAVGCSIGALREGVKMFRAMPHRLEPLGEVAGVLYVDDSKSTNPGSVVAALRAYDRPVVLIAGGRSKGTDFTEMGKEIRRRAKAVILIGEAAAEIAAHVAGTTTMQAESLEHAVHAARGMAERGDVVLLSPGCASFDMFRSAEDRGEQFTEIVAALGGRTDA